MIYNTQLKRMNRFQPVGFLLVIKDTFPSFLVYYMCSWCLVEPRFPSTPSWHVYTSCSFLLRTLYFLVSSSVCCSWRHRGASSSLTPPLCPCHLQSCCKSRHSARGQREHEREEHKRDRRSRSTTEEDRRLSAWMINESVSAPLCQFLHFPTENIHLAIILCVCVNSHAK